jgi:hypothetical protein
LEVELEAVVVLLVVETVPTLVELVVPEGLVVVF